MKTIIKSIILWMFGEKIEKIHIKDDYKVISFDLFDTLIYRTVGKPKNVFYEVEKRYKAISENDKYDGEIRIKAEKRARQNANGKEILLSDIYSEMDRAGIQDVEQIKEIEIETEIDLCEPNKEIDDLFRELVNAGRQVIIISDMYLESDVIVKILEKCNLRGYDRLFISSEVGMSKRHGGLFNYVLGELKIKPNEIIHIGDNPYGDYLMPKAKGWNAFLYRNDKSDRKII